MTRSSDRGSTCPKGFRLNDTPRIKTETSISAPHMSSEAVIGTPGPFEVRNELSVDCSPLTTLAPRSRSTETPTPIQELPRRRYDCDNYETCLGLAASLNWESFTCRGCSGTPSDHLMWRARVSARSDSVAAKLLKAPPIAPLKALKSQNEEEPPLKESQNSSAR